MTLAAHGLKVSVHPIFGAPPEGLEPWLQACSSPATRRFVEIAVDGPREGPVLITEHATDELGTVAFTVEWGDSESIRRRENHYPVRADGVVDCLKRLETLEGGERTFAYPGCIACDPVGRRLTSDPDALLSW